MAYLLGGIPPSGQHDGHDCVVGFDHLCVACHGFSALATARRGARTATVLSTSVPTARPSSPTALAPPGRTCPSTSPVSEIAVWSRPPPEGRRICYDLADPRLGDALRLLSSLDLPGTCDT
jgi:hypothetical protein